MEYSANKHINREISWLYFNERVLQEAMDENTPLIERLKFLGIFSNNRDEFFRVRVATMNRLLNFQKKNFKKNFRPKKILNQIDEIVAQQEITFTDTFNDIIEELKKENIFFINETQLSKKQGKFVKEYFRENVRPHLFPLMLNEIKNLSNLKDYSFYLAVHLLKTTKETKENFALIEVPVETLSRFLILPEENKNIYFIMLDDVIRFCLNDIFAAFGYDKFEAYTIKFTRDAELDIDNDISKSFLELMSDSIKQRKMGVPVRFIYDASIPEFLLTKLTKKFKITSNDQLRGGGRYHNFKDLMAFPKIGPKKLRFPPLSPLIHKDLPQNKSIFSVLKEKDIMLHYPYQSFQYIIDFLREASIDPKVKSIKMTLYRAAKDSNVINALINAARNGKSVTVFLELQARFDEQANIYWSGKLQEEGVKIIQTIPGFKVHSKLLLINRKEDGENFYYSNIGTGNFNESTAKVYADDSLLTSNQNISKEVDKVFRLFEYKYDPPTFKYLIVAPFGLRNFFMRKISNEIKNAKAGKNAWLIFKVNSLVDKRIVKKLYEASQAGVKIQLITRGISVLIPGISKLSENIEAISIVDKFLEHSRVFVFCNDDDNKYIISSADLMLRNLDHRIEVACPIYDKEIQKELRKMLDIQLSDNCKARIISKDKPNKYKKTDSSEKIRAQIEIYNYFKNSLL